MAGIFPMKWKYKKGHKWLQVFYWLTIRYLFVQTFSLAFLLHGQSFSSRKCVSGRSTFPPQWLIKKKSEIFILGRKTIISVVMFQIKDIVWYQAHNCPPKTIKCDEICMFGWRFLHNMNEEKGRICIQCLIPWGRDYNRKQESPSVFRRSDTLMTSDGVEASTHRSESKERPVKVDNRCQPPGSIVSSPFVQSMVRLVPWNWCLQQKSCCKLLSGQKSDDFPHGHNNIFTSSNRQSER